MNPRLTRSTAAAEAALAAGILLGALCGAFLTQSVPIVRAQGNRETIEALKVRPNFYMIAGAGGNIGAQIGSDGVLLVDAGTTEAADGVLGALKKLTDQPILYILDTNADADHVGGNEKLAKAGRNIMAMGTEPIGGELGRAMTNNYAATIVAQETVLTRMSAPTGKASVFPSGAWPTEIFADRRKSLYLNGEGIDIFRQPAAHSDGDSVVFFRGSDVIAAGDVIDATRFPAIDVARGGSIQGEIEALNRVIELASRPIPFIFGGGGSYILPGHGRIYDRSDAVEYRDMIVIIRDVIEDMIKRGMTLDQIKAARPAKGYEPEYGAQPGATNAFVGAVYQSLAAKK